MAVNMTVTISLLFSVIISSGCDDRSFAKILCRRSFKREAKVRITFHESETFIMISRILFQS